MHGEEKWGKSEAEKRRGGVGRKGARENDYLGCEKEENVQ